MDVVKILDFYSKNSLFHSKHDYDNIFNNISWFHQFSNVTIDVVTDYCSFRKLQGVKNSTINREITLIRSAYNFYLKYHYALDFRNPFSGFKLFEDDFIPRFLTKFECLALLREALRFDNFLLHDFIVLALNTGCRASELTSLQWDNVYLDDRYFIIRNSLSKNKKTIYKPINDQSFHAFMRLKKYHSKWVFYSKRTNINIRSFRRGFALAVERAGIGKVRIHDLRHTFASFLVKEGVPLYEVSTLLGHSDVRITQKYAHLAPDKLQNTLRFLPSLV